MVLIASLILIVSPISQAASLPISAQTEELSYTKKKRKAASGSARKFKSCAAARKAGYTHMRRGKAGYSTNLDRDGDGVACDKVG